MLGLSSGKPCPHGDSITIPCTSSRLHGMSLNLITGAPGWLGTRFVQTLVEGLRDVPALAEPDCEARARCLILPGLDGSELLGFSERVELAEGDICQPPSLERFFENAAEATLFHLA